MIKVDFHLHTVAATHEPQFEFDIDVLKEYVTHSSLHAIAITNHNLFDLNQYQQIINSIDKKVYPGIEINLEDGHLILISNDDDIHDFNDKCCSLKQKILSTENNRVSIEEFKSIYTELDKYILIPHYDKTPKLSDKYLQQLSDYICAGEVCSPKKFMYCIKDPTSKITPVIFSDARLIKGLNPFPVRQTFIEGNNTDFSSIKSCLNDKTKVFLSEGDGNKLFNIFDNGQKLSTGLNVVLGERSSGKSHTLDAIKENSRERVKYIEQFSLIGKDDEKFNKTLAERNSLLSDKYLGGLKEVLSDVIDVDLEQDEKAVSNYIDSLLKNARESQRQDNYSKAKLFNEEGFERFDQTGLIELINSTKNLVSNREYREIIENHVLLKDLMALYIKLIEKYTSNEEERLKKEWINEIIEDIRSELQLKTAVTPIEKIDLYKIAMNLKKVEKFESIVELARAENIIGTERVGNFNIITTSCKFDGVADIKKVIKTNIALTEPFKQYNKPYSYLRELKQISGIQASDFYKLFVKIKHVILNGDGAEISGGEKSEFNLLQEIQDTMSKYDMLLIDELESSFDNLFLKKEVNKMIRDISSHMPVVLVTHNNTVGASINPDYILYTKKQKQDGKTIYKVYSGIPTEKELKSTDGEDSVSTFEVVMGCLEAGEETYKERGKSYAHLRNQE
jgi:hypothetical protein